MCIRDRASTPATQPVPPRPSRSDEEEYDADRHGTRKRSAQDDSAAYADEETREAARHDAEIAQALQREVDADRARLTRENERLAKKMDQLEQQLAQSKISSAAASAPLPPKRLYYPHRMDQPRHPMPAQTPLRCRLQLRYEAIKAFDFRFSEFWAFITRF